MHKMLSNFARVTKLTVDATADATHGVDMANYDGVLFLALAANTALTVQAQQADAVKNSLLDGAEDVGAAIAADDIDEGDTVLVDIYRPLKRYVGLELSDATHATAVWAILYHSRTKPVDNATGNVLLQLISPEKVS